MYWPDTGTGVDVEPARKPVVSAVRKFFSEGGIGQQPTIPGGDWFNQITNELLNVLAEAGIDPSKTNDDQLAEAISKISITATANYRRISPRDYGGKDDYDGATGTNNLDAFKHAFEALNALGGGDLYLPKVGTGKYFISGDDSTPVQFPVRICADEGVSIYISYSGGQGNSPLVNTTKLTADRQVALNFVNFGFTTFIGENVQKDLGEILPTVNNGDGVFSMPFSLAGSDFKVLRLLDINTAISPVSSAADSLVYAGGGVPTAAVIPAAAGDEVMALISAPPAGLFFAGVITQKGVMVISGVRRDKGSGVSC